MLAQANALTQNLLSLLRWYEMNSFRSNRNLMIHNRTQGLDNIADILGWMREIAVQAASANTVNLKRVSQVLEFQMLKDEVA
jgi:flagellin-like hook-associated protein FlgL